MLPAQVPPDRVIKVAVRCKKSVLKPLCCELLCGVLSFCSAPGKKKKTSAALNERSSRCPQTLPLQQEKRSTHFRCHFQSSSFHLSQTISPTLVHFLPSFVFFFFSHTSFTMMRFLSRSERSACEEEAGNKSNHRLAQKGVFKRPDASFALARDDGGKESHMIEESL